MLEAQLVAALAADDARAAIEALEVPASERQRVDRVKRTLDQVDEERTRRQVGALDALKVARIDAEAFSSGSALLPDVGIRVADRARRAATDVLEAIGYRRIGPVGSGAWESYQRTLPGAPFVRTDDAPGRIELRWRDGEGRAGHRLLHPDGGDWEAVDLPLWLWPLFHAIHLARLPVRLARRGHRTPNLGPFLGTPRQLITPLLEYAGVGPNDLLVDLGCGDGRILVEAALSIGCRCRGVESNPQIAAEAVRRAEHAGVADLVEIVVGDANVATVEDADVVILFLPVAVVKDLVPKLQDRLRSRARIVSHEIHRQMEPEPDDERVLTAGHALTTARRWDPR